MKKTLCSIFLLLSSLSFAQVDLSLDKNFLPVSVETAKAPGATTVVRQKGYISLMHDVYHIPVWNYHQIAASSLPEKTQKRPSGYPKDGQYKTMKANAYSGSEYDHGHLAPAADFKRDKTQYYESHYMTNMAPQHGCLNQVGWCYLESMTRHWAKESKNTLTHVVSGTAVSDFTDTLCLSADFQIYVPEYFYKAVLIEDTLNPENSRAIGFIVKNDYLSNAEAQKSQCSIDEVEKFTGLDLFSAGTRLKKPLLTKIESQVGEFTWEGYASDCPEKTCDKVYNGRTKPGKRTKLKCK